MSECIILIEELIFKTGGLRTSKLTITLIKVTILRTADVSLLL